MIVPHDHIYFLKLPLSFWIATTDNNNVPEPVKCTGVKFDAATELFTCFVPLTFAKKALDKITTDSIIALVGVELHTFEGYQYKGPYRSHRSCTEEEVAFQTGYMKELTEILQSFGYSAAGFTEAYFRPPFVAVTFHVQQVFDQSPKVGTGGEIRAGATQV